MKQPQVVVVAKQTAFSRYAEEERDSHAIHLLKSEDPTVARWQSAHRAHMQTLEEVERALARAGVKYRLVHGSRTTLDSKGLVMLVTVGGDGTLLRMSHSVTKVPLLGVNSSPKHSVGFFCAARKGNVAKLINKALDSQLESIKLARMTVKLNDQVVSKRVLNEALYSHASPAATSRYLLEYGKRSEDQRSSGFWIGPAAGSTAAQRSAGGRILPLRSKRLQLVVREPYMLADRDYKLLKCVLPKGDSVAARSKMHAGRMFLDGPDRVVRFRLGDVCSFELSDEPLTLLGISGNRGERGR